MAELRAGPIEYRLETCGKDAILLFPGGHMRAGMALGEDVFTDLGHTVLVVSRPGYGRTPLRTGTTPAGFADATRELCARLGIERIAAVVGVSAGGRTAVTMAARYPELVDRLVLQHSLSFLPWPDRRTRLAANVVFRPTTEAVTWAAVRTLLRLAPEAGLRLLLRDLSTEPASEVLAGLGDQDRAELVALFCRMRSGGLLNDCRDAPDVTAEVSQSALVVAGRRDAGVPFVHAESLATGIRRAELVESSAESHLFWFGSDYSAVVDRIRSFLEQEPHRRV